MSWDELVAYFNAGGDISELLRDAGPALARRRRRARSPMIVTASAEPTTVTVDTLRV